MAAHIAKHGSITTDVLRDTYGYGHPPRAKQDLQEQGIPIETFFVKNEQGRRIAEYKFGDLSMVIRGRFKGRQAFPKTLKKELVDLQGQACGVCLSKMEIRYLQIDHRVPYEISGEVPLDRRTTADFMLVCTSCNRAKSWSCEHCQNFLQHKVPSICSCCYWANSTCYTHVSTLETRRLDIVWTGAEAADFDAMACKARELAQGLPDFVRRVLAKAIKNGNC